MGKKKKNTAIASHSWILVSDKKERDRNRDRRKKRKMERGRGKGRRRGGGGRRNKYSTEKISEYIHVKQVGLI